MLIERIESYILGLFFFCERILNSDKKSHLFLRFFYEIKEKKTKNSYRSVNVLNILHKMIQGASRKMLNVSIVH
jgi:hypothetical protein